MRRHLDPALVTSAPVSLEQERTDRQHRYMWTMAGRTLTFIVAVAVPMPLWARLVLIVTSMIVPWLAVMAANQPRGRVHGRPVAGYYTEPAEPLQLDQSRVIDGDIDDSS